jgi:hypothetical protein
MSNDTSPKMAINYFVKSNELELESKMPFNQFVKIK